MISVFKKAPVLRFIAAANGLAAADGTALTHADLCAIAEAADSAVSNLLGVHAKAGAAYVAYSGQHAPNRLGLRKSVRLVLVFADDGWHVLDASSAAIGPSVPAPEVWLTSTQARIVQERVRRYYKIIGTDGDPVSPQEIKHG